MQHFYAIGMKADNLTRPDVAHHLIVEIGETGGLTGYLVGSLERWNDGKKAEEAARVKHNVSVGQYDQATKVKRETKKAAQKAALGKE